MPNPAPTTEYCGYDAKAELTKFFFDRSVNALEQSIKHMRDASFYQSVQNKLADGTDLSTDLPQLNIKGVKEKAPAIVQKLSEDAITALNSVWELKAGAAKVFRTSIRSHIADDSNIPCFDVEYSAVTDNGAAKVLVKTWRRNVVVKIFGNALASETAHKQLVISGIQS